MRVTSMVVVKLMKSLTVTRKLQKILAMMTKIAWLIQYQMWMILMLSKQTCLMKNWYRNSKVLIMVFS
uniref:Uncharacterized protein n=1 Tax=Arundo donax TaxID=35708 RepID=A0A0A9G492_ARUDO